jgi:hypothetical protein
MKDTTFKIENQEFRIFLSDKMKNFNQHILHKINMEVNTSSESRAFRLKNDLDNFLKDDFLPRIEYLLDEIIPGNQTLRYNSLDLEIDLKPEDSLQMAREMLINQLRNKLDSTVPDFSMPSSRLDVEGYDKDFREPDYSKKPGQAFVAEPLTDEEDSLLYFLETGLLPWFVNPPEFSASLESKSITILLQNKVFLQKLKSLFAAKPDALERFVLQMNPEITIELISHLAGHQSVDQKRLKQKLTRLFATIQTDVFKLIISNLTQNDYSGRNDLRMKFRNEAFENRPKADIKIIQEILKIIGFPDELPLKTGKKDSVISEANDNDDQLQNKVGPEYRKSYSIDLKAVYVQNAGMVLAHPFLPQLFAITGCLDERKQLLPGKQQEAIQLLHYLATGEEPDREFNLTFEKYLCGLPLETPLTQLTEIRLADKQECDEVLRSMVSFWPALKNTSPDGLRQMFFHRSGKLDLHTSPHKLYIERKAQDVLLDKLQWNISIVKLPWMNDLLFVEW